MIRDEKACDSCKARERIWLWLGEHGSSRIRVWPTPYGTEFSSVLRVYTRLQELVERYPRAMPGGGIVLSLDEEMRMTEYGEWLDTERRVNLSARYFTNAKGRSLLEQRQLLLEASGQNPPGCHSLEYLLAHEVGHCLRHRLPGPRYATWWKTSDLSPCGANAVRNYSEGFAEAFAAMVHQHPAQWCPAVQRLHTMLEEDGVL